MQALPRIGFLGGGQMATALVRGLVNAGAPADRLWVADPDAKQLQRLKQAVGVHTSTSNAEVATNSDVLLLCVKPHYACAVVEQLGAAGALHDRHLILSIAAGVTLAALRNALPANRQHSVRLCRAMPNTPALVGAGASGFAFPPLSAAGHATASAAAAASAAKQRDADRAVVRAILSSVAGGPAAAASAVFELSDEKLIDPVTGVSGSGPAYVFLVIEALADGGVAQGLPRDVAQALAAQTVLGAAKMVQTECGASAAAPVHPAVLRDRVTSPGGTTAAALGVLEECGVRSAMIKAVRAATQRAQQLAQPVIASKL